VFGDTIAKTVTYIFDQAQAITSPIVVWKLLDSAGVLYASGTAGSVTVTSSSFIKSVVANTSVVLPSNLLPTSGSVSYQIRWELTSTEFVVPVYSFDSIQVQGFTTLPTGPEEIVELQGDIINLGIVLDRTYSPVTVTLYYGNTSLFSPATVTGTPVQLSSGYRYSYDVDPQALPGGGAFPMYASLDNYLTSWKYVDAAYPTQVQREQGRIFIVNPTILSAVEDARTQVMKARTTLFGFEDALFTVPTIISWLRRGRDLFNAAGGYPTTFDMTNATLGIREFWLRYSEIGMLRAQALAEGEKAFNFSGAAISLETDKAQYYQQLADSLQTQLDSEVKGFKANLIKKGLSGGNGDQTLMNMSSTARVGIMASPASQFGRSGNFLNR